MASKTYADNLARSNSVSSRGIAGRGVVLQATGRDLSNINCHCCNKFSQCKKDCAEFKAIHQQSQRYRRRQHKEGSRHQPHPPKPGGQQQQGGRRQMWCLYHNTTTRSDADCHTRPANRPNGNVHFAQVRPSRLPRICSSWDLPVRDDSDEKLCISFSAIEVQSVGDQAQQSPSRGGEEVRPFGPVSTAATEGWRTRPSTFTPRAEPQPATKPTKAQVEEEKGAQPFGPVSTAATDGCRTRLWPFTSRAEPQPATKPAKARLEEEKGARPFGSFSTTATEARRPRPWPFTPRAEKAISFGEPVAGETSNLCYTFGMANDEEPVEKALMTSSSVFVTSEDSMNSTLNTLMAPAEPFPDEVRESLSEGAPTRSGGRASPEAARSLPTPVPATARREAAMRDNRIHRPNVVTRRAAVELTGAVAHCRGVRPNINNNNHTTLVERFQPCTLHKLRQLGLYTPTQSRRTTATSSKTTRFWRNVSSRVRCTSCDNCL